ncbi:ATP-binding cassette domain-containing protein [Streptomyces antnestii]|uniref:ATP-binding cassette domain-containing protein n=1 Tax=Streptomyces antnestii TaxID=2494256 RepID=A0A3S2Z3C5_9ACTN|nr:ATP-binding cassette domain-containing protein [Streptomyces sp. San01]RVU28347.1 ATP-binding cassette domain-containing protein [Streptomyces sp. San01]
MIQAFGLTSNPRQELPPAVDDVSFEAPTGRVTALLGARASGKTTAVRLMLELQQGRGITHFRGRPLHRIPHPSREVGVLLGEVQGHPSRTVRGQLRMLCAAAGVSVRRADEVLEVVGIVSLRDQRLGMLSRGMDRRLGLACALLADPHTLVLDGPADVLSAREAKWLHGILRAHASLGGTVLFTTDDAKEAARTADRVVTLEEGRVIADQDVADFARTRLRPRVAVRSPHAARLGVLLAKEARATQRSVEVVNEDGNRLSVYGSNCADIGETAFRHSILVHQLADEVGDAGPTADILARALPQGVTGAEPSIAELSSAQHSSAQAVSADHANEVLPGEVLSREVLSCEALAGTDAAVSQTQPIDVLHLAEPPSPDATQADPPAHASATPEDPHPTPRATSAVTTTPAVTTTRAVPPPSPLPPLPPPITIRPARSPLRPLRYEVRRATGIATGYLTSAVVLAVSAVLALLIARTGHAPQSRLLAAWPQELPLPPAALGAGLLGAFAFGDEFRHPALAADRGTVPRRLGLLCAKLVVASATALSLAFAVVASDAMLLHLVYGEELTEVPADWLSTSASWLALVVGCAWAGVLAAGVFRSTTAGLAAVLAVPIVVVPLVQKALTGPSVRTAAGLPARLRDLALVHWPFGGERFLAAGLRMIAQPVGGALMLSVTALLCAYLLTVLRPRAQ